MQDEDLYYTRRRKALLNELRKKGIENEHVLAALARVPRHRFVDTALRHRAYRDEALPIGLNQTISQPYTVAYQTSLLKVQPGDRVLEVGTGSGFQAAVLAEMGTRVFSIERHEKLYVQTTALLEKMGYRIETRCGDGTLGWPEKAPFDAILVTAGGQHVPQPLLDQLRQPGGRLVIPVGSAEQQTMLRITRTGPDTFEQEALDACRFVPLIGEG